MEYKTIFPRSPREVMCGWVHLPRLVDKIRLHLAGRLPVDYQANYLLKGFDKLWFESSGVSPDTFVEIVKNSLTDGEVADWVHKHVSKSASDKDHFRERIFQYGTTADTIERFKARKNGAGLGERDDVKCFVDVMDAEEGRDIV